MAGPPAPADERTLARAALGTAIASLVFAVVFAPLHPKPHTFHDHPVGLLRDVVDAPSWWLVDHAGILGADLTGTASLVFLAMLLSESRARRWVQLAVATALATTSLLVVFLAVDGLATRDAALAWDGAATTTTEYAIAASTVRVADGVETAGEILFFGLTFALYGVAVLRSGLYSRAAGWGGIAVGVFGIAAGVLRASAGTKLLTVSLFAASGAACSLWVLTMGWLAWRRARRSAGMAAAL